MNSRTHLDKRRDISNWYMVENVEVADAMRSNSSRSCIGGAHICMSWISLSKHGIGRKWISAKRYTKESAGFYP